MIIREVTKLEEYKALQLSRNNGYTEHLNLDIIKKYIPENKQSYILDIGCRSGQTIQSLINDGYINAYGLDLGDTTWSNLPPNMLNNFIKSDIHDGIPLNFQFELITCSHMLEHVYDPIKVIHTIKNKLSQTGILYISVPLEYKQRQMQHGPHCTFFESELDLRNFLQDNGMCVVEIYTRPNGPGSFPEVLSFSTIEKKLN